MIDLRASPEWTVLYALLKTDFPGSAELREQGASGNSEEN